MMPRDTVIWGLVALGVSLLALPLSAYPGTTSFFVLIALGAALYAGHALGSATPGTWPWSWRDDSEPPEEWWS